MIKVCISHDDAPEWVQEKFIDGIRRYGLTVTDLSSDGRPVCEFELSGPIKMWIVYDIFRAANAYFASLTLAQDFVKEEASKHDGGPENRYNIREVQINTGWE